MIKVFKNHVCLCVCTTAIFSLLQNGVVLGGTMEKFGSVPLDVGSIETEMLIVPIAPTRPYSYLIGNFDGHPISAPPIAKITPPSPIIYVDGYPIYSDRENNVIRFDYSRERGSAYIHEVYEDGELILRDNAYLHDGVYYICDKCETDIIDNRSYKVIRGVIPTSAAAIMVKGKGTEVHGKKVKVSGDVSDETFLMGAHVLEKGKIVLDDPILKGTTIALRARKGVIKVKRGKIEESQEGVDATENSLVVLEDTDIKTAHGYASLLSYEHSEVRMSAGSVDFMNSHGVSSALGGKVMLDGVVVTGKGKKGENHAVFLMDVGGKVDFKGRKIDVEDAHGILLKNSVKPLYSGPEQPEAESETEDEVEDLPNNSYVTEVNLKDSSVKVKGEGSYGIYFRGEKPLGGDEDKKEEISLEEENAPARLEVVNLDTTNFSVLDDVALYGSNVISGVASLMKSTLRSESALLKAEKGASITVLAVGSTLEGGAYVDKNSNAELYLGDHSEWILRKSEVRKHSGLSLIDDSSVSHVTLMNDSSIKFTNLKPEQGYTYQTLKIGNGTGVAYKAGDGAHIFLNTYLNSGGALDQQKTDRVLIHGDVSGETMLHVHAVAGSPGGYTGSGGNEQGISIIQVSGAAEKDSFKLNGDYVALDNAPYQYRLYAYGPGSNLGQADTAQRLVEGSGEFWDFRLESRSIDSDAKPELGPEPEVKAVVPQVPTYLLLPNALGHLGLMNVSNQNKWLESLRIVSSGMLEMRDRPAFFVRGYGGNQRYTSNLSVLEYGYGGELDYNAIEAGILLKAIENAYGAASFGVIGSYEKFSLQPLNVEQSQKSTFDKWSVAAYGGMQHDAGFYLDGLVSYGLFKGDVLTTARGKTATLKGNPLSASLTAGKTFMVGEDGFVFDPQVQVVYQYLQFNKARDVDGFDIELGKLHQWVGRVGGRLTKMLVSTDKAHVVSFYGKLHLAHGFEGKQFVHFKDAFQFGAFGSSLETGLGFNAQLSRKFALHGDLVYQHKLTKAGFSGTSFSGGLRYHF
ncbi:autotransporter outer membrane beta-barrel domain-containing protein [Bartonella florencae]|uniref:autotransporter family protein n=1 Tax=Bartonella florencae TaxID=928210 RepID=UPI00056B28B3|nr:autotransporter outer membrane beta-barrel domain-containing protein [Bartonella florencae]